MGFSFRGSTFFSSQSHPVDGLLRLVLITGPTLTYGSQKLLVHGNGHTPVNRVDSRAKLGEGSTWRDSMCDGVCQAPPFKCTEDSC